MAGLLARAAALSIAGLAMVAGPAAALADERPASGPVIGRALTPVEASRALSGLTVEGEYESGAPWEETFHRDGRSTYSDAEASGTGTMRFTRPGVCFTYPPGTGLAGGCFEVWRRGKRCFDFYGIANAAAMIDRRLGRGWSARAWTKGGREDCGSDLVS